MANFAERFNALHKAGPNLTGIFTTGRDLTTSIEARFGMTDHGKKAIHDVLCALEECAQCEKEKIDEHLERERVAKHLASQPAKSSEPVEQASE